MAAYKKKKNDEITPPSPTKVIAQNLQTLLPVGSPAVSVQNQQSQAGYQGVSDPYKKTSDPNKLPMSQDNPQSKTDAPRMEGTASKEWAPKFFRDADTGKITGVQLPDGRTITGIAPGQAKALARGFTGGHIAPAVSQEEQMRADIQLQLDRERLKQQMQQEQAPPPVVTAQQLSEVGQFDPNAAPNPEQASINQEIQQNIAKREFLQQAGEYANILPGGQVLSMVPGLVNTGKSLADQFFPGAGSIALSEAQKDREVRKYFDSYSNEENLNAVSSNVGKSVTAINTAITMGRRATTAEEIDRANYAYKLAWEQLDNDRKTLKILGESGDQRKWADKILPLQRDVESYFNDAPGGWKFNKDQAMIMALNKKDVVDTASFENVFYGGGMNG